MDQNDNKQQESSMRPWIIWMVLIGLGVFLLINTSSRSPKADEITYQKFYGLMSADANKSDSEKE